MIFSLLKKYFPFRIETFTNIILILILFFYYLYFINKGLIFYDEGLYVYVAELISKGFIPYKDFFLQYQPLYFYVLAGLFKVFGPSIIIGRLLSLVICLGIFTASLSLLKAFKISSLKAKLIVLFCVASFGYPLINIPMLTWVTVLITQMLMLTLLKIFKITNKRNIVYIGMLLAAMFLIKQNVAVAQTIFVNILLFWGLQGSFLKKAKTILLINIIWISVTFTWVYYFFLYNNIPVLYEYIAFNLRLPSIYPFTYPSLLFLFQPLGFIKLIPYYLPIAFLLLLTVILWRKKADKKLLVFFLPLMGFFTTIFPASDLLHVYPYFGLVLVSLYIFSYHYLPAYKKLIYVFLAISIVSGLYLTFFREYYRYHAPYKLQNTALNLPKAKGIFIDQTNTQAILSLYTFINTHTESNDYIFAYPFSSMQYFLFERQNPSRFPIYYPGYLSLEEEKETLKDIKKKKTKYVITDGTYIFNTPISQWIVKQKKVKEFGPFTIFEVRE